MRCAKISYSIFAVSHGQVYRPTLTEVRTGIAGFPFSRLNCALTRFAAGILMLMVVAMINALSCTCLKRRIVLTN